MLSDLAESDSLFTGPNGVMFCKPEVRKVILLKARSYHFLLCKLSKPRFFQGILPRMLEEILDTRVMVKRAMKSEKDNAGVTRLLNARQVRENFCTRRKW